MPCAGARPGRRPAGVAACVAAGLLLALASGCGSGDGAGGRSALLITLDTTRADALSCYGVHAGVTPHLDRLAAEGILYENAYTVAPITAPAHASMLTGLAPPRHGVRSNGALPLSEAATTVAERAQRAGIETRAWISASVLDPAFGLGQGFDGYESPESPEVRLDMEFESLRAHDVVREVLDWLDRRDASRPFLAWVHLWDPHRPWHAEPRFQQKGPYLSEVASADDAVGILIEALRARGLLEQTTVLVVGDHGEGLGEHGEKSHGLLTYQSTLRVPLILRPPGTVPGGRREPGVVSVVDVAPTLIEVLGLPKLSGIDGHSLLAGPPGPGRGAYFESYYGTLSYGWHQLVGWVDDAGKYVFCSEPVVFDLETDPGELAGRPADSTPEGARYRAAIEQLCALPALPAGRAEIVEQQLDAIRSLGYVASTSTDAALPAPLEPSDRLDPMHNIQVVQDLAEAMGSFGTGEVERAEELLLRVLEQDPGNAYASGLLGTARLMLGRHAEAVGPLLRAVNHGQDSVLNLGNLAVCYLALGQEREALDWFERAYERNPRSTVVLKNLAGLHHLAGRDGLAERFGREYEALTGERP